MCPAEATRSTPAAALVWALIGPKHGDNAQVRALAGALARATAARIVEFPLHYHGAELLVHLWPGPTLAGLRPPSRRDLAAPWPDLVIGAGRRSEPVARWIRHRSGGRARIVHLGRPWSAPAAFDLIVSSGQYQVPAAPNVLESPLPLTEPALAPPAEPAATPCPAPGSAAPPPRPIPDLPRPWTGVLLGGASGYLIFDADRARDLAGQLNASRATTGGSLLVSGSPRTPAPFLDAFEPVLEGPRFVHRFAPHGSNPYPAILAGADVLVVTSDSVSMVLEALATGKPVYLYDVRPRGPGWWRHPGEYRWRALSHRFVQAFAPQRFRRDVRRIHEGLVAAGRARWFDGRALVFTPTPVDPGTDLQVAVDRIRTLLAAPAPGLR